MLWERTDSIVTSRREQTLLHPAGARLPTARVLFIVTVLLYLFPIKTQSSMNKLFVGISSLPFTALNPKFESHFHAGDNIYDTAPWGYNNYSVIRRIVQTSWFHVSVHFLIRQCGYSLQHILGLYATLSIVTVFRGRWNLLTWKHVPYRLWYSFLYITHSCRRIP